MLTLPEKIIFTLAALVSAYAAWIVANRIARTIGRGRGKVDWRLGLKRLGEVLVRVGTMQPTFKIRLLPSIFHAFVAWGFMYYLLVNVVDTLEAFFPSFHFLGSSAIGGVYRLIADFLTVGVLVGMTALIIRRWVIKTPELTARRDVLLSEQARRGIRRDSAIVGAFIMVHVGSRFMGRIVNTAQNGRDPWEPFASAVGSLIAGLNPQTLTILSHVFFWLALGTILGFIPYFLISKHLHLIMAPINYLLKPERPSFGALDKIDFNDESIEQFGVSKIEDLCWEQIMDAYACIMCYRCQQVCPAYDTGKVLSPAAMEINKRYFLNNEGGKLAKGEASSQKMVEFAIPPEAIWACTACGACVNICPVGNEPMRDILSIRRSLVLDENAFPSQLQTAFRGMERNVNPWNIPPTERMKWAEGLEVPRVREKADFDILWWVGCAPATDARAQKTARAFATILKAARVNYAVLGEDEQCNGDSARRAGNEYLFFELANANVEMLNEVAPKRIVTTCPHCLHVLKNEYPAFGGHYEVVHHTQFIGELLANGSLKLRPGGKEKLTFHDPCYLGRQNGIVEPPREVLQKTGANFVEMPRHGMQSFCCGAGGAQMWKEEEHGDQRVNAARMKEALATGAEKVAVGCPFCMVMLTDAVKAANASAQVVDIAEIVVSQLVD